MPRKSVTKRDRRRQEAVRRSQRLAKNHGDEPEPDNYDTADVVDSTTCDNEMEEIVEDPLTAPRTITIPSSLIECLPAELVLLIGDRLPVEARIALALTSRTMMLKSGSIGTGTRNVATDVSPDLEHDNYDLIVGPLRPSPLELLLELLERDLLLLTRCDYCRVLHSPLWKGPRCTDYNNFVHIPRTANITLPLIRRAMLWHRKGLDAGSLLASVGDSHFERLINAPYNALLSVRARAVGTLIILKQQLFIARDAYDGRRNPVTARDIATLESILRGSLTENWWVDAESVLKTCQNMKTAKCRLAAKGQPYHFHHYEKCYRDDVGPSRRALPPQLRCLLTHPMPCDMCRSNKASPGRVTGSEIQFEDYSVTAIPAPDKAWGRILVFTIWRDLGDGSSLHEVRWRTQHKGVFHSLGCQAPRSRKETANHPGDIYAAYEGAGRGTRYVPALSTDEAKQIASKHTWSVWRRQGGSGQGQ